ncbi:ADP-ribose pyrophosphatase [Corynebacterium mustelae]|uniref:ADP-ribose pyrophosphatase n=1 Tax=Corynebacterium mustelae TaxID=571915 RepID=A0A0G3H1S1_9CORY|nr:NUDIX hydrolase [Corynebacterium mustelae]AKK07364.1 ADP-ribose pyrophosphatase [Corynebacterium mustelae]
MTENNRPHHTKRSGDDTSRRRRHRRGRGEGSGKNTHDSHKTNRKAPNRNTRQSEQSANPSSPTPNAVAGGKREKPNNAQSATNRTKNRRRRTSEPAQTATNKRTKGRRKAAAKTQRTGTHRKNYRRSTYPSTQMETRIETSAGGLVISGLAESVQPDGNVDLSRIYVALIGRLDRRGRLLWSMPKGHVENGEDIAVTAEREVWEETGIHGEVFAELGVIDYWFVSDGTRIHKTVHHHLLRYVDGALNDEDPEVTEVSWIPASALIEHFAYADERKLARIAHTLLPDLARKELAEGRGTPR